MHTTAYKNAAVCINGGVFYVMKRSGIRKISHLLKKFYEILVKFEKILYNIYIIFTKTYFGKYKIFMK